MFDSILVPLDGSETAKAAVSFAQLIPCRRVKLLQVLSDPSAVGIDLLHGMQQDEEGRSERAAAARASLNEIGATLRRQGRTVEILVESGDPTERILQAAGEADLIAMTSHGYGAGRRVLYGSVADRVVRYASAPTLVVRGGERPVDTPALARIVVPLDGSPLAEHALPLATSLGAELSVPLHLVRVVDVELVQEVVLVGTYAATKYGESEEAVKRRAHRYLDGQMEQLRGRNVVVTSEVRTGPPGTELLAVIKPGDLVVMTTHGRSGLRRWLLGSVADKLVRNAPAPVLLCRPDMNVTSEAHEPSVAGP